VDALLRLVQSAGLLIQRHEHLLEQATLIGDSLKLMSVHLFA